MNFKNGFLLLALSLIIISCNQNKTRESTNSSPDKTEISLKNVDAVTFKKLVEAGQGTILDVRTMGEVAQGHLPNAFAADIYQRDFVEKINQLPKDKEVYVYCTVGARSSQAAQILISNGFKNVYNLNGGIIAWSRSGYTIEK
jgi:rhodanese-related sulfurtransferase